jgi:histidinol-phosphate aminotransferase
MSVLDLLRPAIRALKPYVSARSLAVDGAVFLDANESPWPLAQDSPFARLNRYPEPQPRRIAAAAAALYGVPKERLLVSRGADEGIEVLTRAVCEAGRDRILVCPPTYGVYETAAGIQGCGVVKVPLRPAPSFAIDVEGVTAAVRDAAQSIKLVYLCTPNNPTGTVIPLAEIEAVCAAAEGRALVVVDEAYLEFSGKPSILSRLASFPNLVVLKTLSKAWGLAGARCGFTIGAPELIAVLQGVRAPYPLSSASIQAVEAVFNSEGEARMRRSVADVLARKKELLAGLAAAPLAETVFPGEANFVLVRARDKDRVLAAARKAGILLRDRGGEPGLSGCIRVTVGRAEENEAALRCFQEAA